jgi:hypothetical protein
MADDIQEIGPQGRHLAAGHEGHRPAIRIPVADIKRLSAFVPAHSTFFAIYPMQPAGSALKLQFTSWW